MLQLILQEHSIIERIHILEGNAVDIIERYEHERLLEEDELEDLRVEFTQNEIEILKLQEEKAQILSQINEKLKPLQKASSIKLEKLRTGRERVVERCFVLEDTETGAKGTYNPEGILLSSTPGKRGDKKAFRFDPIKISEEGEEGLLKAG